MDKHPFVLAICAGFLDPVSDKARRFTLFLVPVQRAGFDL